MEGVGVGHCAEGGAGGVGVFFEGVVDAAVAEEGDEGGVEDEEEEEEGGVENFVGRLVEKGRGGNIRGVMMRMFTAVGRECLHCICTLFFEKTC